MDRDSAKKLARNALVYLLPNVAVRGASFLLAPVYAAAMPVEAFGIVALTSPMLSVLSMVLMLGVPGALSRLHFEAKGDARAKLYGTAYVLLLGVAIVALVIGEGLGAIGVLDRVFHQVTYTPYLRLVLVGSAIGATSALATTYFISEEKPLFVARINVAVAAIQIVAALFIVVLLRRGAQGVIEAQVIYLGAAALISWFALGSRVRVSWSGATVKDLLWVGLPLLPHSIAAWALTVADRLVLERTVGAADLGRYGLAAIAASVVPMVAQAVQNAFFPMVVKALKEEREGDATRIADIGVAGVCVAALGVGLGAAPAITFLKPEYHAAGALVPGLAIGVLAQGLYYFTSLGTWIAMRTVFVPFVTIAAALVNVGLNLLLVPRYGVVIAPWASAAGYVTAMLLHGVLAHYLRPIRWHYRRWAMLAVATALGIASGIVTPSTGTGIALRVLVFLALGAILLVTARPRNRPTADVNGGPPTHD